MAPSDEDIPDLFPSGRKDARPPAVDPASHRGAPRATPTAARLYQSERTPKPPVGLHDPGPRPSRPVPGPDSGLELQMVEDTPLPGGGATRIAGTAAEPDELEFDLTSRPPPDFEGARTPGQEFDVREASRPLLDLGAAPQPAPPGTSRSSHPPSKRPPRADASSDTSIASRSLDVPSLDVPFLRPQASHVPAQRVVTSRTQPHTAAQNVLPGSGLAASQNMGREVDFGDDLDDLGLGGAAAAQMNLGLSVKEEDADVPWPLCRTPARDECSVSVSEAEEMAGFGPPPTKFLQTPLYALRIYNARASLQNKLNEAHARLRELEHARDETLAELASDKRKDLHKSDRFAPVYADLDKHEQNIKQRQRAFQMADAEGALALREGQAEIDMLNAERLSKAKARDDARILMEEAERTMKRSRALVQRLQIEWRNVEARAARTVGSEMPEDLSARLDALEEQQVRARVDLDDSIQQFKEVKRQLSAAENAVRVAAADVQRAEEKKESLLIGYEGEIAECSRALDRALSERLQGLASAGRAIIELRGQVPVAASVRSNLLAADDRVVAAARHLEIVRRALGLMDLNAYRTGRAVWLVGILVLLVSLVWSAI